MNNNNLRLKIGQEAKKIAKKLEFNSIATQYLNLILNDEYSKTS